MLRAKTEQSPSKHPRSLWRRMPNAVTWIVGAWDRLRTATASIFTSMKNTIVGIFQGIWGGIKTALNFVIGDINRFTSGIAKGLNGITGVISLMLGIEIGQVTAPQIPLLAKGGVARTGGSAIVGEAGPELLHLPRGAEVRPLEKAGTTNNIEINIAKNKAVALAAL